MIGLTRRIGMRRRHETVPTRATARAPARALPVAVLLAVLAVGGCAGTGDGGADRPGDTPTEGGSSTVTPSAGPTPTDPTDPTDPGVPTGPGAPPSKAGPAPTAGSAAMTLTGTVTEGVEPNCLLLDGYLLVGGPRDVVRAGARLSVTGRPEPGLMTTCQQGTPFRVESARSA